MNVSRSGSHQRPSCARRWSRAVLLTSALGLLLSVADAGAQAPAAPSTTAPGAQSAPADPIFSVTVIGTTPLPGPELPITVVPSPAQAATAQEIDRSGALDLADFLNRQMNGVHVNDVQNNPFQPDVNYRGYTASPLLGTPQGLSVYMDGVRLNQPFGEVVSWDLIPRLAIASTTLMPGSNPLFGLNTLGGALSVQTKDGRTFQGTTIRTAYGSDVRRGIEFEHGGQRAAKTLHWYFAGTLFDEDGWRDDSPSRVRQVFSTLGWQRPRSNVRGSIGYANNSLTGNGLQDYRLLERDYASIYTKPDTTDNRSTLLNVSAQHELRGGLSLLGQVYYRDIRTNTVNGDINEDSLDQSLYQPDDAQRAALAAAGYGSVPSSGLDASNTPFPSLPCIANTLLNDEPSEACNGLINQTHTAQRQRGLSTQVTHRRPIRGGENVFTAGAAMERSVVGFTQSSELGYLNPDRSVTGVGAFGDGGLTGGTADGEPFDTRVDLDGDVSTWSVYLTDTLPIGARTHVTASGRYNRTSIENRDLIEPGGGPGSLDGHHVFARFNPAAGVTFDLAPGLNLYGGYSEGSRAATSIELGCANPDRPCKLPNAMAGDPPLNQVVTRTVEAGVRAADGRVAWHAGIFHAENHDDILFVTSEQTGFGYFTNIDHTRRQGVEVGARLRLGRVAWGAEYTFLRATFESEETVNGESNSTNDAAENGQPGLEGSIEIEPGDRLPLIPRHLLKIFGNARLTRRFSVDLGLVASGDSYARGNENNQHQPDGAYYLGAGTTDGYAIVNLGARYALTPHIEIVGQVDNLFGREYATAAQLGPAGFTEAGTFAARALPAIDGEFPVRQTTFLAPGAPRRAWLAAHMRF